MKTFKQLRVVFDLPLHPRQIPRWRGALIEWAGRDRDLFHNHRQGPQNYYRYPLVQYQALGGQAAVLAINEGADQLEQLLTQRDWFIRWRDQLRPLQVDRAEVDWPVVALSDTFRTYRLQHWLPFNQENYRWWKTEAAGLQEKVDRLERILCSHLLTFATGIRWQVPEKIVLRIQDIRRTKQLRFHGSPVVAFDLVFDANLILPPCGLGRAVSHGFGVLDPVVQKVKKQVHRQPSKQRSAPLWG